jgi:hypothetical protein
VVLATRVRDLNDQRDGRGAERAAALRYVCADVLEPRDALPAQSFHLLYDKGTLDSVAMAFAPRAGEQSAAERAVVSMAALLRPGARLLELSCNHSEEELDALFVGTAKLRVRPCNALVPAGLVARVYERPPE